MSEQTVKRPYKATFILNTRGVESPIEDQIAALETALKESGGDIRETKNLGRLEFVRVTERDHTGDFFVEIHFDGPTDTNTRIQDKLRLDKTVKRILIESDKV